MKDHAQFAEDLALYAMGALDAQQCPELQAHLGACGECRRELEALRADVALLALSATGPQPPQRSRQRLMDALSAAKAGEAQKAQPISAGSRGRARWLTLAPAGVALVLAVVCIGLLVEVQSLKHANNEVAKALQEEKDRNTHAKAVAEILNSPTAQRMTLVSAKTPAVPHLKTFYERDRGRILLIASNLQPLPADKSYQLWLIPARGGAPMPAGIFRVENDGSTTMMHTMEAEGVEAKSFAVTVEPLRGSKTPTMPIWFEPSSQPPTTGG